MSDKKISQLTASTTPLAGTEVVPIVQSGVTKQSSVDSFVNGRDISPLSLKGNIAIKDASGVQKAVIFPSTGGSFRFQGQTTEPMSFWINNVQIGEFNNNRDLKINNGNLVIGTAGKGIDFSADGQAAGMTSELLDDYEEGTWTPTFASSSGSFTSITYDAAVTGAKYTKIGNAVYIQGSIRTSAITVGTASGNLLITGLPFSGVANATGQDGNASGVIGQASSWAVNTPSTIVLASSQITLFHRLTSNGAFALTQVSDAGTGSASNLLRFSCTYLTA